MKLPTPYLTRCCNRFSLKFGSKVVGWYSLVASVFSLFISFYSLGNISHYGPDVAVALIRLKIIFCLLDVAFSILLLIGLHKKHPQHYLTWIIAKSMIVLCEVPLYIVMSNYDRLGVDLFVFLFLLAVDVYGILVVHGYFIEITTPTVLSNTEEAV